MKSKEGKAFVLGVDVVKAAGEDVISELQDNEPDIVNTVYFDVKSLNAKDREDEFVRKFMSAAQKGKPNELGYEKDGVNVILKAPERNSDVSKVLTSDPHLKEQFRDQGIDPRIIEDAGFLIQDPSILKHGIQKVKIDGPGKKLEDCLDLTFFDLKNPFINQFVLVQSKDGSPDVIYQVKQDFEEKSEDRFMPASDIYLKRIMKNEDYIHSSKSRLFDITTNHLHQYLALEHLLLDDMVKLVVLSGGAGTGKTLLPYIAGLAQSLKIHDGKNTIHPKFDRLYLTKADNVMGGREIGFLKGGEDEKMAPIMQSYAGVHEECGIPYSFEELQMLENENTTFNRSSNTKIPPRRGIYELPNPNSPLIKIKHSGFLRGVTIRNSFILIDEAQNFTRREMKDLLSRAGKGSKVVVIGDPLEQIDHPINTSHKNGIVWAAKGHFDQYHPHLGMMHFVKNERSPIADYTNNIRAPRD